MRNRHRGPQPREKATGHDGHGSQSRATLNDPPEPDAPTSHPVIDAALIDQPAVTGETRRRSELLWMPINLLQAVSLALVCLLMIPPALLVLKITGRPDYALWMARSLWAPIILAGGLSRLRVKGLENIDPSRRTLVVCNHRSYADIPVLYRVFPLPLRFIGKRELAGIPLIGRFGRAVGTVFVDRSTRRRAADGIAELTEGLVRGEWTVSFPEGTRSHDGTMGSFSSGTFASAIAAEADILPVAIEGTDRMLARGGFRVRPSLVTVIIGQPIPTRGMSVAGRHDLVARAKNELGHLLGEHADA